MARLNANEATYTGIKIFDIPALFIDERIDRKTIPEGLYVYEIRHADDSMCDPCEIAHGILVNFYGTVITNQEIDLSRLGYRDIDSEKDIVSLRDHEDYDFIMDDPDPTDEFTLEEFVKTYLKGE